MTKDLAMLVHGNNLKTEHYLYTEDFLEAINQELKNHLSR